MAEFTPKKIVLGDINNGIEFTESDGVTPNAINDPIEAVAYAQTVVEHLTDTPDTSEIDGVDNPNVSFVSSTTADGVTIYKFKFSNLSAATFTPSLDEAGNLSWSNNRNLPNPPTINIKGDGLEIKKWYDSTEAMNADYSNPDIAIGDAVAISGTLDLYVKGASAFESTGTLKGEKGDGLDEIVDGTLTAKKAEQDADGNSFSTSYAKKADLASGFAIGTQFDGQNITANCTLIRCSGSIVIASGVSVNAIDCPSLTATGSGTLLRNGYAVGDFFIGTNSPAARAGGEWTQLAAGQTIVSSGDDYTVGATGGAENVTLNTSQLPQFNVGFEYGWQSGGTAKIFRSSAVYEESTGIPQSWIYSHNIGGNQAHENMPPYYVTNIWRRTA